MSAAPNRGRPQPQDGDKPPGQIKAADSYSREPALSRRLGDKGGAKSSEKKVFTLGIHPRSILHRSPEKRIPNPDPMGTDIGSKGTTKGSIGGGKEVSSGVCGPGGDPQGDARNEKSMGKGPNLFASFCGPQKRGELSPSPQPKRVEQNSPKKTLSLRRFAGREEDCGPGALRLHRRFGASVPPYPRKLPRSEETLFPLGRQSVRVDRSPLRAENRSILLYPHDKTHPQSSQQSRDRPFDLPGRLVDSGKNAKGGSPKNRKSPPDYSGVWVSHKLEKERVDARKKCEILRSEHQLQEMEILPAQEETEENENHDQSDSEKVKCFMERSQNPSRQPGRRDSGHQRLQTLDEGHPARTQAGWSPKSPTPDTSLGETQSRSVTNLEKNAPGERNSKHPATVLQVPPDNGCISHGVGSDFRSFPKKSPQRRIGRSKKFNRFLGNAGQKPGALEDLGKGLAHHSPRGEGFAIWPTEFPAPDPGKRAHLAQDGQFGHSWTSQKARGKIRTSDQGGQENLETPPRRALGLQSYAYQRGGKYRGGLSVTGISSPGKLCDSPKTPSEDSQIFQGPGFSPRSGQYGREEQSPPTPVLVQVARSRGRGRGHLFTKAHESPGNLYQSPMGIDSPNFRKSPEGASGSRFNDSSLGIGGLVEQIDGNVRSKFSPSGISKRGGDFQAPLGPIRWDLRVAVISGKGSRN